MKSLLIIVSLAILLFSCQQDEPAIPTDFGYLSLGITLEVASKPASGRVAAVNTDNFKVTIFQADGTEYLVIDPYSSAPSEVQLPTGEYYVEAHSNDLVEAAFDSPYYFAQSDTFTIDKEELKTIDIEAKLANAKVAINFSNDVTSTFDAYTGAVTVVSSGTTLTYAQGETREGYFVVEPLAIEVYLSYTKLDGSFITRQFTTNIDAQPKTLYNVNVDAALEDGKIVININVDESFETVDVDLTEAATSPDPGTCIFDGEVYNLVDAYIDDYAEEDPLEIGTNTHFGYSIGVSDAAVVVFTEGSGDKYFVGTDGASMIVYFEIYAPEASSFITGTFDFIDDNTATLAEVEDELFFTGGEIELDDDGILPNGDFDGAEYDIIGGSITITGTGQNYTVDFDLETEGGAVQGNFSGDFKYLDNTTEVF